MNEKKAYWPYLPHLLKAEARRLGFTALGIAPAELEAGDRDYLLNRPPPPYVPWQPTVRSNARAWLPGAQSVLVGAVSYRSRLSRNLPGINQGYFSPFAHAPDYHREVSAKLHELAAFLLNLRPATRYTIQVDNGPGCERLFALKAGVGWQGKNNFIIVPGEGSFVWLGLLVTDLALPPDRPLASQCGDCDLCLRACPTGAYKEANDYDYTRCLAYWLTDKNPLSSEQKTILGEQRLIYGCDYCQLACPHNSERNGERQWPELKELLSVSTGEFKAYFSNTAALWRGANILRRNLALAAAGNDGCQAALKKLSVGQGLAAEAARYALTAPVRMAPSDLDR